MGNYVTINFKTKSLANTSVYMENQCSFENNGKIYHAENGKINIFDKATKTWTTADSGSQFVINDYQLQTIRAYGDNCNETDVRKAKKTDIVLSRQDIQKGIEMYSKGEFRKDLNKELKGDYEAGKSWLFNSFQAIASYINNKVPKFSGNLVFSIGTKENSEEVSNIAKECFDTWNSTVSEPEPKTEPKSEPKTEPEKGKHKGLRTPFDSSKLFSNPQIIRKPAFEYTYTKDDALCYVARRYGVDTYTLIAANPDLKQGKDYKLVYDKKQGTTDCIDWIKPGRKIIIPERYSVKPGSAKSFEDVAKITNVSVDYIKDLLTVTEVDPSHPGEPDTTAYPDGYWTFCDSKGRPLHKGVRKTPPKGTKPAKAIPHGMPTIGFGHCGLVDDKAIVLPAWNARKQCFEGGTKITKQKSYDILCNDILEHNQRGVAYFGKSYEEAPESVRSSILDLIFNKGIHNGFMQPYRNDRTKLVKKNLENKQYGEALANTRWMNTTKEELRRRNVYRFVSGLRDLPASTRKSTMASYKNYYQSVLRNQKGLDKTFLQKAWENAENGKAAGFKMKSAQIKKAPKKTPANPQKAKAKKKV